MPGGKKIEKSKQPVEKYESQFSKYKTKSSLSIKLAICLSIIFLERNKAVSLN